MGTVKAVCISEKKGTPKKNIGEALFIEDYGVEKDAHAGKWHRQVSLLSYESIEDFKKRGAVVEDGAFGENLIVSGFDFKNLPVGTRFICGDVVLEMTQIGKQCHQGCAIQKITGGLYYAPGGSFCQSPERRKDFCGG